MKRWKPLLVKPHPGLILWFDMCKWQWSFCWFPHSKWAPCVSAAWNKGLNIPTKRVMLWTNKKPRHILQLIRSLKLRISSHKIRSQSSNVGYYCLGFLNASVCPHFVDTVYHLGPLQILNKLWGLSGRRKTLLDFSVTKRERSLK